MQRPSARTTVALALAASLACFPAADSLGAGEGKHSAVEGKRKRAPTCKRKGSRTIRQSRRARVFEVRRPQRTRLYGCLKRVGRRIRLAEASSDEYTTSSSYQHVRLAGRFVGWEDIAFDESCKADCPPGYNPSTTVIRVYDLRRRRSRSFSGTVLNEALILTRRGSLAWAQRSSTDTQVEVHAAEGTTSKLLDRGNVDPDSLRRRGSSLVWTKDGVERSAPFR